MSDGKAEQKAKKSIRRKSSKRQSRKPSRRQSRKKSTQGSRSLRNSKRAPKAESSFEWELEELELKDIVENLNGEPVGESPIDLEPFVLKKVISLPLLKWLNTENRAFSMKIANTGYTSTITGLWAPGECPKLTGGPLKEEYCFSQVHFHWGENENFGSEHLVNHQQYPLEVHAVFYKSSYGIHERARRNPDGFIVVVYFYTLSRRPNSDLEPLIANVIDIPSPYSEKLIEPFKYSKIFPIFTDDYILYNGWVKHNCEHSTMWFICRETLGINKDQLEQFKTMTDNGGKLILKNYREVKETGEMKVFIVSPSTKDSGLVLHPRPMTPDESERDRKSHLNKRSETDNKLKSRKSMSRRKSSRRQSKRQSKVKKSIQRKSMKRKSKVGGRKSMKK